MWALICGAPLCARGVRTHVCWHDLGMWCAHTCVLTRGMRCIAGFGCVTCVCCNTTPCGFGRAVCWASATVGAISPVDATSPDGMGPGCSALHCIGTSCIAAAGPPRLMVCDACPCDLHTALRAVLPACEDSLSSESVSPALLHACRISAQHGYYAWAMACCCCSHLWGSFEVFLVT